MATRILVLALSLAALVHAQTSDTALKQMADTERAFAKRATVIGWKQAFLEYFADDAVGFDGVKAGSAKDQIRQIPDPPKDAQLLWEPRYGDIAASGELGWLTGPSTSINPARNNGAPRYGNYASVWKRQADGTFKVIIDVGINTADAVKFADGFTRAPAANRYTGGRASAGSPSLADADLALTKAAMRSQADGYRARLAAGARLHRQGTMPLTTDAAILAWLQQQPPYSEGKTGHAEVARSGDLGYTWGSYATGKERGSYVRVWTRQRDGAWKVALDVTQPE
jgi:ketosteroid isomerase-like protein